MKILSFDTSNNLASVAIMANEQLLAYNITDGSSQQAEKLFSLIKQALEEAKLQLTDIDLISVTNGPGSFTGVRIGLAAALGLQMSSASKFIALTNFQVLAWQAKQLYPDKPSAVILDARRDQVYFQLFNSQLEHLNEPELIATAAVPSLKHMVLVGDGAKFLSQYDFDIELTNNANAKLLAASSKFYLENKLYQNLAPLYIREPDAVQLA